MKNNLIKTISIVIVVGILGFYCGMQYQKSQQVKLLTNGLGSPLSGFNQERGIRRQGSVMGISPVSGEITAIDSNTITIKTQDGGSKIIVYSSSTKINKISDGSTADLKVGEKITAIGSENSGAITAQSISLGNGMFQFGTQRGVQSIQDEEPSAKVQ